MRRKVAKQKARELRDSIEWWFRKHYNLPPTDSRFLDCTIEDMETDFWAHFYDKNGSQEEFEDEDFDVESVIESFQDVEDVDDWEEVDLSGERPGD